MKEYNTSLKILHETIETEIRKLAFYVKKENCIQNVIDEWNRKIERLTDCYNLFANKDFLRLVELSIIMEDTKKN